ncbi:MAG TPA: ABC transporter transmembrane domain-containing protein, partial [Treponemataceae bacterium]|nr:ABC transporter transmembrane domain-containing protein [Treponemataceae bacterium]
MPVNTFKDDEDLKESLNISIIKRLVVYLKPHKKAVGVTLFLMSCTILVELLNPYFLKTGIDKFIRAGDSKNLLILGGVMIILNAVSMVCSRSRIITMGKVTNKILLTIRQQLYTHIQKLSFAFFDNRPIGKILARIIGDVNSLNDLFTNGVTS